MESGRVSPPLHSSLCADEIQENFPQISETFWILWFPMLAALWQSQLLEMGCSALCSLHKSLSPLQSLIHLKIMAQICVF